MAKLPVLRLVRHAYLDLVANWRGLVQVGALWLVLPWVLIALGGGSPLAVLGVLVLYAGLAAVSVAWHRRILLGEPLPARFAPVNGLVARYLAYYVLMIVAAITPGLVLARVATEAAAGDAAGAGLLSAALLAAVALGSLVAVMRLQLVFPATAIDDRRVSLGASWRATRGNGWRLLAGVLLVSAPATLAATALGLLLDRLAAATGSLVLGWLGGLAPVAGAWLPAPLLAAFLSYAYLFLRQGPQQPPQE